MLPDEMEAEKNRKIIVAQAINCKNNCNMLISESMN